MTPSRSQPHRASASAQHQHQQNQVLLQRLRRSRASAARLHWRNALVVNNLALVRLVANRESRRSGRPFDELHASGCLGLIRAVEAFDLGRGVALSSFAVPYIRGAMLQEQRDREQPLHTPRRLRELQRRAETLIEQRRGAGLAALSPAALAAALDCSLERLEEAGRVKRALAVASLDAPAPGCCGGGGDEAGPSWLERLSSDAHPGTSPRADPQCQWLQHQLDGFSPRDRQLIQGRWIDQLSWKALALQQGCSACDCRRRGEELLACLQARAHSGASQPHTTMARSAARAV
jgi:RNA polymerase sigma-B factor